MLHQINLPLKIIDRACTVSLP